MSVNRKHLLHQRVRLFNQPAGKLDFGYGPQNRAMRQHRREEKAALLGGDYGTPSIVNALCAHGAGRLRRQRVDDTGKGKAGNLFRW